VNEQHARIEELNEIVRLSEQFQNAEAATVDALPFGRLWYTKPDDAFEYAKFFSRSHDAVIRVYDEAGNVIETTQASGRVLNVHNIRFNPDNNR